MNRGDRRRFMLRALALGATAFTGGSLAEPKVMRAAFKVVVVGGGYGGATAARYLKLIKPALEVTLVERAPHYLSCPGSNEVLSGLRPASWLERRYDSLAQGLGIRIVRDEVTGFDRPRRQIMLAGGARLPYDRVVLSPGIGFRWDAWAGYDEAASKRAPHAWQAGPQTLLLQQQLAGMRRGGVMVIVAPPNPYRCPPGPYERASLAAYYLKRQNPRAKILIIDPKTQFSKQALFLRGWQDLYPGMIEWMPMSAEGAIDRIDVTHRIVHLDFGRHAADVLNVIPPQKAGALAERSGLTDESGWCPVDARSFLSSRNPLIHVIGDACAAPPMPKSAFAANTQAKVAAAAIVDAAEDRDPGTPSLINHCYSFLAPDYAISVTGVYRYSETEQGLTATATGETPMDADRRLEARSARAWQRHFARDAFG
jgi:sulfide dehydrogenase [flavocytochrome c] flavoprotein subunit